MEYRIDDPPGTWRYPVPADRTTLGLHQELSHKLVTHFPSHESMNSQAAAVALVTGGSAGLGFHIASKLLGEGYQVVLVGRDASRLQAAIERLPSHQKDHAQAEVCDLTDAVQIAELMAKVGRRYGRLDVLVN